MPAVAAPDFQIAFYGGAGTVTGSKHLLQAGRRRVLIDCGLFQGLKELRLMNWRPLPFEPSSLDAAVLTHTHIDHCGYFPRLGAAGYRNDVWCSPATRELAPVLLADAAKLQEEDAEYANRKGFSKHHPALPLFTEADVRRVMGQFRKLDYGAEREVAEGVTLRLHDAGHVLGSAFAEVSARAGGAELHVVFSGDVGRYGVPVHVDPQPLPACDVLVIESTYGDRPHDRTPLDAQIRAPFRAALERGGTILIPAFALARIQVLTVVLREAMASGAIPHVPVHIDSPMAVEITAIYHRYAEAGALDPDVDGAGWRRLFPPDVHLHATVGESKQLNDLPGGRIILSSSGMLTGGRVLHHLRRLLPDARNLIALAGYQAPGTRGRALLEGAPTLRMHGADIPVRAQVMKIEGLSSHADGDDLLRWVRTAPSPPRAVYVTHGEPESAQAFAARIREELGVETHVPALGDTADLSRALAAG
jgi:metallo-beta-lactamase family protein